MRVASQLAERLVQLHFPMEAAPIRAVEELLQELHRQTYSEMMSVPNDQLAGYRGMLFVLDMLSKTLTLPELKRTLEKSNS